MRSKIEANEYKDYILGFMFYKFLSEKELKYLKDNDWTDEDIKDYLNEDDEEIVKNIQKNVGYFIEYKNLFSTWIDLKNDFDVSNVNDALSSFDRLIDKGHKKVFDGIFKTLQTGLTKLGDDARKQTKAISDLIYLIQDIPMDGKQDYDVLGFIYEDLISNFASNAGKKAGEFYTPHEVSLLMSEIVAHHLKDKQEIKVYDPTSGSGSLLITIGKSVAKYLNTDSPENKIKYYAQELKENTYNLTRMNLVMRGILPSNIVTRNGDTLEEDWPYFDDSDPENTYNFLSVDAVVSNPPYSQSWDPTDKETDARYKSYGLAPKSKADYAFLLHDLYHVKPDGLMTIVLPHGVLFRGGEEGQIRKNLIENNKIDAIIGLPANIFFGTGIPTIIMVLKQKRTNTDVLIIDASKGFAKVGKNNVLRATDIKKIIDTVKSRKDIDKFSKVVSRDEIRLNDYNLNIPRYVDSSEKTESWDLYASMFGGIPVQEVDELAPFWEALPGLKEELFLQENSQYLSLKKENIEEFIFSHESVENFMNHFTSSFSGFEEFLQERLVQNMQLMQIPREEEILSNFVFEKMDAIPLVNPYEAYQLLYEEWNHIAIDLEMIQTEGKDTIRLVDPVMVEKKKKGKDIVVQDGWAGHVLPFELVQKEFLTEGLEHLKANENRLVEIASEIEQILEELPEEEKEAAFVNDEKTAFVMAEVKKAIKAKDVEDEILASLKKVNDLLNEEKSVKKQVKDANINLILETKEKIENLTDDEVELMLKHKWISPIIERLFQLPQNVIRDLVKKVENLEKKYENTLFDLEHEIRETEDKLSEMIDQLTGDEFDMLGLRELKKLFGGA